MFVCVLLCLFAVIQRLRIVLNNKNNNNCYYIYPLLAVNFSYQILPFCLCSLFASEMSDWMQEQLNSRKSNFQMASSSHR